MSDGIYQRQLIDCNCNDCIFMIRDSERFKKSQEFHHDLQLKEFTQKKTRLRAAALQYRREYELEKYNDYMFHVVVMEETPSFPVMAVKGHYSDGPHCRMYVLADNEQRIYREARIIGVKDWETKRQKIKLTTPTEGK
jgi:hypothetical protein